MARARNIKPGFFKNEILGTQEPIVMLLFAGLWCLADKAGRLEDRPIRIKAELFPYREKCDVNRYLTVLEQLGFLQRYKAGELALIQITNFEKHQHPHHTERESELPEFKAGSSLTVKTQLPNGCTPSDSLIPDSLIPDSNALSGKPDPTEPVGQNPEKSNLAAKAKAVLQFLNEKTGRAYEPVESNLKPIVARMKEGATETHLRQVIAKKCREWGADEKMEQYLRPKTLFNATNFANYKGELVVPQEPSHA